VFTYLLASPDPEFRFDWRALHAAAPGLWGGASAVMAPGEFAHLMHSFLTFVIPDGGPPREILVHDDLAGLSVKTETRPAGAQALAWLCSVPGQVPEAGSVAVYNWAPDLVFLRPGMTQDDFMAFPDGTE